MTRVADGDVLVDLDGGLGRITLNRPKAINALTHPMVRTIDETLARWADDPDVRAVLLTGAGDRGLCAGGDIVSIHRDAQRHQAGEDGRGSLDFWRDEYVLNARIGSYPKPYIAVMDGIVLGGGVGVSAHARARVVTEYSTIGMPEVGIGFVPDVGGTYLLARTPGEIGAHAALTTERLGPGDAIAAGFADHFVPRERIGDLIDALQQNASGLDESTVAELIERFERPAPDSERMAQRDWIDACFSADTVESILDRLDASDDAAAAKAAQQIRAKSPTALKVTLRSIREAGRMTTLDEVLDLEYRVSTACLGSPDLVEGIRAQVVDKDRKPKWRPATLEEVTDDRVDAFFAPLGADELGLGAAGLDRKENA